MVLVTLSVAAIIWARNLGGKFFVRYSFMAYLAEPQKNMHKAAVRPKQNSLNIPSDLVKDDTWGIPWKKTYVEVFIHVALQNLIINVYRPGDLAATSAASKALKLGPSCSLRLCI